MNGQDVIEVQCCSMFWLTTCVDQKPHRSYSHSQEYVVTQYPHAIHQPERVRGRSSWTFNPQVQVSQGVRAYSQVNGWPPDLFAWVWSIIMARRSLESLLWYVPREWHWHNICWKRESWTAETKVCVRIWLENTLRWIGDVDIWETRQNFYVEVDGKPDVRHFSFVADFTLTPARTVFVVCPSIHQALFRHLTTPLHLDSKWVLLANSLVVRCVPEARLSIHFLPRICFKVHSERFWYFKLSAIMATSIIQRELCGWGKFSTCFTRKFPTSCLVAPCPQVMVPASSSSNTWRVAKAEGDDDKGGFAAKFLKHQRCVEMTERSLREIFGA